MNCNINGKPTALFAKYERFQWIFDDAEHLPPGLPFGRRVGNRFLSIKYYIYVCMYDVLSKISIQFFLSSKRSVRQKASFSFANINILENGVSIGINRI
jgi:hypothetical protein